MKLGAFDPLFGNLALEDMLDKFVGWGLQTVEVATGGYVGNSHADPAKLLENDKELRAFKEAFDARGLSLSALSCHGNPLHPDEGVAKPHHDAWTNTVKLAQKLGVDTVVTFSGLPGGGPDDKVPNWHVCAWPTDHADSLEWQWRERVIPYWQREAEFAESHGVRVALEMHPRLRGLQPRAHLVFARRNARQLRLQLRPEATSSGRASTSCGRFATSVRLSTIFTPKDTYLGPGQFAHQGCARHDALWLRPPNAPGCFARSVTGTARSSGSTSSRRCVRWATTGPCPSSTKTRWPRPRRAYARRWRCCKVPFSQRARGRLGGRKTSCVGSNSKKGERSAFRKRGSVYSQSL